MGLAPFYARPALSIESECNYLNPYKGDRGELITTATVTCPICDSRHKVDMPTESCQIIYKCPSCGAVLTPEKGDDCVFCSYADVKCPPKQLEGDDSGHL
jgi:hypothetical protein